MQRGRILLEKATTDLRLSLDRIGQESTVCVWVQTQLNLNLPDQAGERLCYELREVPNALAEVMPGFQPTGYS